MPQRHRRKLIGISTIDGTGADTPNVVWAVDFQFAVCEQSKALKICSNIDGHTRKCIGGLVERSITANRCIELLEALISQPGTSAVPRCNDGPEFISNAVTNWHASWTASLYTLPGQPWRNRNVASSNAQLRKCQNTNSFLFTIACTSCDR